MLRSTNAVQTLVRVEEPVLTRSTGFTACAHPALTVFCVCLAPTTVLLNLACMGNALNSSKGKLNRCLLSGTHFFFKKHKYINSNRHSSKPASIITAVATAHFRLMCTFMWCEVTFVSVKLAGWVNIVSRKRMSAYLIHVRMVAAVWTAIMATLACVNSDSEVLIFVTTVKSLSLIYLIVEYNFFFILIRCEL